MNDRDLIVNAVKEMDAETLAAVVQTYGVHQLVAGFVASKTGVRPGFIDTATAIQSMHSRRKDKESLRLIHGMYLGLSGPSEIKRYNDFFAYNEESASSGCNKCKVETPGAWTVCSTMHGIGDDFVKKARVALGALLQIESDILGGLESLGGSDNSAYNAEKKRYDAGVDILYTEAYERVKDDEEFKDLVRDVTEATLGDVAPSISDLLPGLPQEIIDMLALAELDLIVGATNDLDPS